MIGARPTSFLVVAALLVGCGGGQDTPVHQGQPAPKRVYTLPRLIECCRVLQLDTDPGIVLNGHVWDSGPGRTRPDPRTRECLWYLGLLDSKEAARPASFREHVVIEAVLAAVARIGVEPGRVELDRRVATWRREILDLTRVRDATAKHPSGRALVAWLETRLREGR